jgi:hypothetical protein
MPWYWVLVTVFGSIGAYLALGVVTERLRGYVWGVRPSEAVFWTMALWPLCLPYVLPFAALVRANAYERYVWTEIIGYGENGYRYMHCRIRGPLKRDDNKPLTRRQQRILAFEQAKADQEQAAADRRLKTLRQIEELETKLGTGPVTD